MMNKINILLLYRYNGEVLKLQGAPTVTVHIPAAFGRGANHNVHSTQY
jgi:hypothetical protein